MKKLLSIILVLSMVLGMGLNVFADTGDTRPLDNAKITDGEGTRAGGGPSHFFHLNRSFRKRYSYYKLKNEYYKYTNASFYGEVLFSVCQLAATYFVTPLAEAVPAGENVAQVCIQNISNGIYGYGHKYNKYKVYFNEYTCEIPGVAYYKITKVKPILSSGIIE